MLIVEEIIKKVFEFLDGEDIKDWLENVGECQCEWNKDTLYIQGKIKTAIYRELDPVNCYVCIMMALFGPYWVWIGDKGLDLINKEWKKRIKQKKKEEEKCQKEFAKLNLTKDYKTLF